MDFQAFWQRFILRRIPDRRFIASMATGSGSVKSLKGR
jgi:hypothetical protein